MKALGGYIRKNQLWMMTSAAVILISVTLLLLNEVQIQEIYYSAATGLFVIAVIFVIDFIRYYRKHRLLCELEAAIKLTLQGLPQPRDTIELDYQNLIRVIHTETLDTFNQLKNRQKDQLEYYTMWVHQIKTPIAAMRLLLQEEDSPKNQELSMELFQIEQYVEMVLQYLRLDADTTDYIIERRALDNMVRQAVRKYARLFVGKRIQLDYTAIDCEVLTDEKWLVFVLEQLISNAIKYTEAGTISIYMEEPLTLVIEDTGIGIRAEDLPRVCEKGYTGFNGHNDKRSTGIGLYLCKRILTKLSHTLTIESEQGIGTKVKIGLQMVERVIE